MGKCNMKVSNEDIAKFLQNRYKSIDAKDVTALHKAVVDNVSLSTHFTANPNTRSNLNNVDHTTDPHIKIIFDNIHSLINNISVNDNFDKTFINPSSGYSVTTGWQSFITTTFTDVTSLDSNGNNIKHRQFVDVNIPKAIALATASVLSDYVVPLLPGNRSDEAVRALTFKDKKSYISPSLRKSVGNFDALYNPTVQEIGIKAFKLLGLKPADSDVFNNDNIMETFIAELGMIGLHSIPGFSVMYLREVDKNNMLTNVTLLNPDTKVVIFPKQYYKNDDSVTNTVKIVSQYNNKLHVNIGDKNSVSSIRSQMELATHTAEDKYGMYKYPVTDYKNLNIKGATSVIGDNEVSTVHRNALKRLGTTGMYHKPGYVKAIESLNSIVYDDGSTHLTKLLGYIDPSTVIKGLKEKVNGKNKMITDLVDNYFDAVSEFGVNNPMYAKFDIVANGRFYLDSNKFNYQDKKLHRMGVYAKTTPVNSANINTFKIAIAQSFGVKTDKMLPSDSINSYKRISDDILNNVTDELSDVYNIIKESDDNTTIDSVRNTAEYVNALVSIIDYVTSKYNKEDPELAISGSVEFLDYVINTDMLNSSHESSIMPEGDGKTSGRGIKLVLFPLFDTFDEYVKELERVGVYVEGKSGFKNVAEFETDSSTYDAYNYPAKIFTDTLKSFSNIPEALKVLIDPDFNGGVISRSFMKSPVMVADYGAGIKSIVDNIIQSAEINFYDLVNNYYQDTVDNSIDNTTLPIYIKDKLFLFADTQHSIIDRLMSDPSNFELTSKELSRLKSYIMYNSPYPLKDSKGNILSPSSGAVESAYKALEVTFDKFLGKYISLNNNLNSAIVTQFKLGKLLLDNKLQKRYNYLVNKYGSATLVPPVTKKELYGMIADLSDVFPVINTALNKSDGNKARMLIASFEKARKGSKELLGNVSPTGAIRIAGKMHNSAIEVYSLVEAVSSGMVLPVHFFDSGVIAHPLSVFDGIGIHDGLMTSIDDIVDSVSLYNKAWITMAKDYSPLQEVIKSSLRTLKEVTEFTNSSDLNALPIEDLMSFSNLLQSLITSIKTLDGYDSTASKLKEKLFNSDLYVSQMYFQSVDPGGNLLDGSYKYNSSKDSKLHYTTVLKGYDGYGTILSAANTAVGMLSNILEPSDKNTSSLKAFDDYLHEVDLTIEQVYEIQKANALYLQHTDAKVFRGSLFEYDPQKDVITTIPKEYMDESEYEVYLAHEIRHRITYDYLSRNIHSNEVKYLLKAVKKIAKDFDVTGNITFDDMALFNRLKYMTSKGTDLENVAEIVAILSSEPNVRNAFIKHFPQKTRSKLHELFDKLKEYLGIYSDPAYIIPVIDNIVEENLPKTLRKTFSYNNLSDATVQFITDLVKEC